MLEQKRALTMVQKNLKAVLSLRSWKWMHLWTNIQPLLQGAKKEEERLAREAEEKRLAEVAKLEAEKAKAEAERAAAEAAARAEEERKEAEKQRVGDCFCCLVRASEIRHWHLRCQCLISRNGKFFLL